LIFGGFAQTPGAKVSQGRQPPGREFDFGVRNHVELIALRIADQQDLELDEVSESEWDLLLSDPRIKLLSLHVHFSDRRQQDDSNGMLLIRDNDFYHQHQDDSNGPLLLQDKYFLSPTTTPLSSLCIDDHRVWRSPSQDGPAVL
jgi:hypothetical protein